MRLWGATRSATKAISSVGRRRSRLEHHEGLRHLARLLVGRADHRRVRDRRMGEQQRLQLGGRDLEALVLDELLQAVDDEEVAVVVDVADVAGVSQPSASIVAAVASGLFR